MRFVLVDLSQGARTTNGESMTPELLARIANAANVFLNRDFGTHWGGNFSVRAGAGANDLQPGEVPFALLPTVPAPGAIAYHDWSNTGPTLWDAITLSDSILGLGNSVSVAITHELAECAGDTPCNLWADDGSGTEHAYELCDSVESNSYSLLGVGCSDFVLPAFFEPGSVGPYNFMTAAGLGGLPPSAPFATAPGGYQILRTAGEGRHNVSASYMTGDTMRWQGRASKRQHAASRATRRGLT